jgi:glycosyltransferase involved in cell wall biosynthesis
VKSSIAVVYAERPEANDAIRTHSKLLVKALKADSVVEASFVSWSRARRAGDGSRRTALSDLPVDAIFLAYNPFSYGRWGFAPRLCLQALRLRVARRAPRFWLIVHEPFVPMINWRWTIMGVWQRIQLWTLSACAEAVLVTTEGWRPRVHPRRARRPIGTLPVGSNLPDMRAERENTRGSHGWTREEVVVAAFGTADPARLTSHIASAANGIARAGLPVTVLNLGAGAPPIPRLDASISCLTFGELPERSLAGHLAAADIFLAPFADGVSTRRTTVMAALQHGLAVVGTSGANTDRELLASAAVILAPVEDPEAFAEAALLLALDRSHRERQRVLARELFERRFDWPVIARRLVLALEAGRGLAPAGRHAR